MNILFFPPNKLHCKLKFPAFDVNIFKHSLFQGKKKSCFVLFSTFFYSVNIYNQGYLWTYFHVLCKDTFAEPLHDAEFDP